MAAGPQLKQARDERTLTLADVSRETKIQPWVLEALEADQLHQIMSPVYAKGFLTTYAKFLRLDPERLLAQLVWPSPEPEPAPLPPPAPSPTWHLTIPWEQLRRWRPVALAALGLLALMLVNPLRWLPSIRLPHRQASVSVVTEAPPRPSLDQVPVTPAQQLELSVTARAATWIRVRADGKLLSEQRLPRGAQERWTAKQQLELIIAKPSQVELVLNGESISPLAIAHRGRLLITSRGVAPLPDEP